MSTYRKVVEELSGQSAGIMACLVCQAPTSQGVLARLGARCEPCYAHYCRHPDPRFNPPAFVAPNVLASGS